jgi:hypothetical protein
VTRLDCPSPHLDVDLQPTSTRDAGRHRGTRGNRAACSATHTSIDLQACASAGVTLVATRSWATVTRRQVASIDKAYSCRLPLRIPQHGVADLQAVARAAQGLRQQAHGHTVGGDVLPGVRGRLAAGIHADRRGGTRAGSQHGLRQARITAARTASRPGAPGG